MIELQSALEGTENKFVALFVKGLMFLVRLGFDRSHGSWVFTSSENHPLVKILLYDGIPIIRLLVGDLKFLPRETADVKVTEVQQLGVELAETTLSLLDCDQGRHGGSESIFELLKRLFVVQKDLGLEYTPELSATLLSLSTILAQSELEHEQFSLLKLLIFLFRWKKENDSVSLIKPALSEELVLMFPVLNLMSSTSKSVKAAATGLIGVVENFLVHLLKESNPGLCVALKFPHKTTVGTIMYRLLQHLWVQVAYG
ncbi:Protein RST1 [Linum perenne]